MHTSSFFRNPLLSKHHDTFTMDLVKGLYSFLLMNVVQELFIGEILGMYVVILYATRKQELCCCRMRLRRYVAWEGAISPFCLLPRAFRQSFGNDSPTWDFRKRTCERYKEDSLQWLHWVIEQSTLTPLDSQKWDFYGLWVAEWGSIFRSDKNKYQTWEIETYEYLNERNCLWLRYPSVRRKNRLT